MLIRWPGIGMLIGNFFNVKLMDHFTTGTPIAKTIDWNGVWMGQIVISVALLVALVAFFKKDPVQPAAQKA